MMKPVAIIGCGGHASVVRAALLALQRSVVASTCTNPEMVDKRTISWDVMTDSDLIARYRPEEIELVLGIGWVSPCNEQSLVQRIVRAFVDRGFQFTGFQHPFTWISSEADIDPTAQIHAGAIIQPGVIVGPLAIVNTKASVDHDCRVGAFCHLAPGVTLSGHVRLGAGCHVGTGSSIIQEIDIGDESLIAAGSVVVHHFPSNSRIRGVPAKPFPPIS